MAIKTGENKKQTLKQGRTRDDIIALRKKGGQEMAQFRCIKCGSIKDVYLQAYMPFTPEIDKLRGVDFCKCGGQTAFELIGNVLTFIASKEQFIPPNNPPKDAAERFSEAKLCYFAQALRATAVMLRSSLELSLKEKGIAKGTLEEKIDDALAKTFISKREYTLAHATRLIGNDSIHEAENINLVEVESLFGAVTQITNKLFP